jgi:hypothetical protein
MIVTRSKEFCQRQWRRFGVAFLGISPKAYERYGNTNIVSTYLFNMFALPVAICLWVWNNASSYAAANQREEALAAVELNRRRFYGRDVFNADLNQEAMGSMYNRVYGYVSIDHVSGIKKTMDGKYTGPRSDELDHQLRNVHVTEDMVSAARTLHSEKMREAQAKLVSGQ